VPHAQHQKALLARTLQHRKVKFSDLQRTGQQIPAWQLCPTVTPAAGTAWAQSPPTSPTLHTRSSKGILAGKAESFTEPRRVGFDGTGGTVSDLLTAQNTTPTSPQLVHTASAEHAQSTPSSSAVDQGNADADKEVGSCLGLVGLRPSSPLHVGISNESLDSHLKTAHSNILEDDGAATRPGGVLMSQAAVLRVRTKSWFVINWCYGLLDACISRKVWPCCNGGSNGAYLMASCASASIGMMDSHESATHAGYGLQPRHNCVSCQRWGASSCRLATGGWHEGSRTSCGSAWHCSSLSNTSRWP
jgi:hypothetical protein